MQQVATTGKETVTSPADLARMTEKSNPNTLYVGNLHAFVDENTLQDVFSYAGLLEQVKLVRDKTTGANAGYGFVKYYEPRSAQIALQTLAGKVIYGREVRLNWAFQSSQREDTSKHHHIFVGDLSQDVTDAALLAAFSAVGNCSDARVMWDHSTGRSKGYGFVSFRNKEDAERSIHEMHGKLIGSRRVRCGWAQHKMQDASQQMDYDTLDKSDPTNTNVYIGNISPELTEADIRRHFSCYGQVVDIKLHKKGGYGFVRYQKHSDAVNAILQTRGQTLTGKVMKCSWGKHPDIPTGRGMMMPQLSPMSSISHLGVGEQMVQGLLPAQYGMLPTGVSPMTSQNLILNGFQGQVPVNPGQQAQVAMMTRPRAAGRIPSVNSSTGGAAVVTSAPFAGGYYPPVYYESIH
eukprot:g5042.t1